MLKRASGWSSLVLVVSILLAISGAQAAAPIVSGGGELLGATGVNVAGTVYDVQIVEGTCVDLYDGCDDLSDPPSLKRFNHLWAVWRLTPAARAAWATGQPCRRTRRTSKRRVFGVSFALAWSCT
jgi:hypothetical protein